MPYIPVPNVAQLEYIYSWGGQVVETVLHYRKEVAWDITTLNLLAVSAISAWTTVLLPQMSDQISLTQVRATDLASQTGPVVVSSVTLPLAGDRVSPSLPNNVAMVVTKRTAQRGRSFRGRIYHPGLCEDQVLNNTVLPVWVATLVDVYDTLRSLLIAEGTADMVVVSRHQAGVPLVTGQATIVTNMTSDGVVDSQRRRLPGRGS